MQADDPPATQSRRKSSSIVEETGNAINPQLATEAMNVDLQGASSEETLQDAEEAMIVWILRRAARAGRLAMPIISMLVE